MKTCIVGGGGFIGKYVVAELLNKGHELTVVGRKPVSPFGSEIKYLSYDKDDPDFFGDLFRNMDEVVELAYSTTPQTSFENPVKDIIENLAFSVRIFEALVGAGVKKIVYVSSGGTVYGQATELPIREDHPTNPVSPYGITKLSTEKYGLMYHASKGLPVILVRPGNAYGIGQLPYLGQGFVSTAISSIIENKQLTIYGSRETIRDYIYVEDVAKGIVAALEYGVAGECYNIGTRSGHSNLEIIEIIKRSLGLNDKDIKLVIQPSRSYDVQKNVLESSKLKAISGWHSLTSISEGVQKTIEWLQNFHSRV